MFRNKLWFPAKKPWFYNKYVVDFFDASSKIAQKILILILKIRVCVFKQVKIPLNAKIPCMRKKRRIKMPIINSLVKKPETIAAVVVCLHKVRVSIDRFSVFFYFEFYFKFFFWIMCNCTYIVQLTFWLLSTHLCLFFLREIQHLFSLHSARTLFFITHWGDGLERDRKYLYFSRKLKTVFF